MIKEYKGFPVLSSEDAVLPIVNRGDGSPLTTDKAKHVLLENGETLFACGVGDCPHFADTIQGVINSHLGKKHPEMVTYRPKGEGRKISADLMSLTLGEILELASDGITEGQYYQTRLELLTEQRNTAVQGRRQAERELDALRSAATRLLGTIQK